MLRATLTAKKRHATTFAFLSTRRFRNLRCVKSAQKSRRCSISRDREVLSLSAVDKNYSSSSADECELLPLLGGRRIVAAS
jgi:hypothetical protein